MNIKRAKDYLLHLNNLRKAYGNTLLYSALKSKIKLQIIETLPDKRTLVLSPHPDDDVIGCGGALSLLTKQNTEVKTVYLTQGSSGSENRLSLSEKKTLGKTREDEARKASGEMGVLDVEFWRYKDGDLSSGQAIGKLMKEVLAKYNPEVIFCPTFQDPHPDHAETIKILYGSMKSMPHFNGEIWMYEVWSPLFANRLLKIDQYIETKKQALVSHKSQLSSRSYLDAVLGLASYRAGMYSAGKYAEAFFVCNRDLFVSLYEMIERPKK